ncbi:GNAT family N-acetyltransferase [Streptomyces sp. bgisy100]|uniref:GNAT family N-acetyltransferase n=1 Tax=Streptomyces sp. bgisy100 TaxID=3413783 RepID=UPI003D718355
MPDTHYLATGPRVAIRHIGPEDMEEFTAAVRASTALLHPYAFLPSNAEEFEMWSAKFQVPSGEGYVVCERETGRIEAGIAINNIVYGAFQCGAVGYGAFAHSAGRGLMTEGLGLVIRHAFGALGLHRLEANIQPGNVASLKLVKRLGFRHEGFSPDFLYIGGEWRDHERWAITSALFRDRPAAPAESVESAPTNRSTTNGSFTEGASSGDSDRSAS